LSLRVGSSDIEQVCVIGLGEVGLPTAAYISGRSVVVWGYDISEEAVAKARSHGIKATSIWGEVPKSDLYVVCVSSMLKRNAPDLSAVFDVCEKITTKMDEHTLVSIESTIVPGTCRTLYRDIFKRQGMVIHVPHRYWGGDPMKRGVNQLRVFGAIDDRSMKEGLEFYGNQLEIPLHVAPSIEVAEMSKIVENAYRYVQIAFAEELKMICEEMGFDFQKLREACNTKWNIQILEARDGIGGHCLPKDVRYCLSLTKNANNTMRAHILKGAIKAEKEYREACTRWLRRLSKG